ncbi:hypothetical protein GGH97_001155 [Coemansia sp. RSA 475]|nr:hypothetical protein GGH97_001155 [Coemansia sp. RSA 475]
MFKPDEIYHFYNNLLYKAARRTLPPSSAQRVPTNHELAVLNSRNAQGYASRVQMSISATELQDIVSTMRKMLKDMADGKYEDGELLSDYEESDSDFSDHSDSDESVGVLPPVDLGDGYESDQSVYIPAQSNQDIYDQQDYMTCMANWFGDFSFVLTIKGIKDACQIAYTPREDMSSLNQKLEDAIPYIDWGVVDSVAKHVAVDYGIEWMPINTDVPTTLAWWYPCLKPVVKAHGADKPDKDLYCHIHNIGGLRSVLYGGDAQEIHDVGGALYCQYYLGEKSLVYSYELAHSKKKLGEGDFLQHSSPFETLIRRCILAAKEGSERNWGARAEYRLIRQTDESVMAFMECLVARIERHKAIIKLPSQAVFGLKLERYKAIKYMAERLSALPKYELKLTRYQDLGIYLRYILFGTLSRPEDYSTTRDSIKKYNVNGNIKKFNLPIANWLTVHYLNLSPTNPFAVLVAAAQQPLPEPARDTNEEADTEGETNQSADAHSEADRSSNRKRRFDDVWVEIMPSRCHLRPPANFGAPPYEGPLQERPRYQANQANQANWANRANRGIHRGHNPNSTTRHVARLAVIPTHHSRQQQPEEQPGEHYEDLDAPLLALIAQKAKAIFDRFKLDFVTRMPTAEETLLRPATDIAKMYWTEDNWRRVVRPNFKLIFQHVTKSKLKWPGRFAICFGKEGDYAPHIGRGKSWNNIPYLQMLHDQYTMLDQPAAKQELRIQLWKLFLTLQVVPYSVISGKMWEKLGGKLKFVSKK